MRPAAWLLLAGLVLAGCGEASAPPSAPTGRPEDHYVKTSPAASH